MDNSVIQNKLISLKRCIERIESKIPESKEGLINSYDLQDIITLNLQRAIQISVDIAAHIVSEIDSNVPATMAQSFQILNEKKSYYKSDRRKNEEKHRFEKYCRS